MIDPTYLSFLRGTIRAEMLLTMVQLEQRCPGWWPSQADLAEDLGLCRDTLTRNIYRLMRKGLVGASTNVNAQGAWVYWVKRSADDRLDPNLAPAYVLRDRSRRLLERLPLDQCKDWARPPGAPCSASSVATRRCCGDAGRWRAAPTPSTWREGIAIPRRLRGTSASLQCFRSGPTNISLGLRPASPIGVLTRAPIIE